MTENVSYLSIEISLICVHNEVFLAKCLPNERTFLDGHSSSAASTHIRATLRYAKSIVYSKHVTQKQTQRGEKRPKQCEKKTQHNKIWIIPRFSAVFTSIELESFTFYHHRKTQTSAVIQYTFALWRLCAFRSLRRRHRRKSFVVVRCSLFLFHFNFSYPLFIDFGFRPRTFLAAFMFVLKSDAFVQYTVTKIRE